MERTLSCKACKEAHTTVRKDTKYCPSCSMLRTLLWARSKYRRPRHCCGCDVMYRPHRSPDVTALCGQCIIPTLEHPYVVVCAFCKRDNPGPDRRLPVCFPCIRNPAKQKKVLEGLMAGQNARKAANACV